MKLKEELIAEEIVDYIKKWKYSPDSWYADAAPNPAVHLRDMHNLSFVDTLCIFRETDSVNMARNVISYLINRHGLDGRIRYDGDKDSVYVYAFLKKGLE